MARNIYKTNWDWGVTDGYNSRYIPSEFKRIAFQIIHIPSLFLDAMGITWPTYSLIKCTLLSRSSRHLINYDTFQEMSYLHVCSKTVFA